MMSTTSLQTKVEPSKTEETQEDKPEFDYPSFKNAKKQGEVTEKDGWHRPNSTGLTRRARGCNCRKTTDKGAYRDVTVEVDGYTINYLHQHSIMVENPEGDLKLSSCGRKTRTTKMRLNKHLPSGYRVYQEDFTWYLSTPNGEKEFTDGMVISKEERTSQAL